MEKVFAEEVANFKKKAENDIWSKMGKAIVNIGADKYTVVAVKKAYMREKKEGFPHCSTVELVIAAQTSTSAANGREHANIVDKADKENSDEIMDNEDATKEVETSKV
jgi:hypothetical protein